MLLRLLGPVEIETDDGRVLAPPRRRERCLLAILALEAGKTVPAARLCDLLWDDDPPAAARRAVSSHVARIRRLLAEASSSGCVIDSTTDRSGYRLRLGTAVVDAHRFRELVDTATTTDDLVRRERLLRSALALWHGPALHNAAGEQLAHRLCANLDELRLQAAEGCVATGLELGRHDHLLPELALLVAENPLRERLTELSMLVLDRSGRPADALAAYHRLRTGLAESLGLDPGPELQRLHAAILRRGEPAATAPARPPRPADVVPAQLPAELPTFVGREDTVRRLDAIVAGATSPAVVITGTAGIGKTSLALHWAHRVRDWFPDGQLYVNLHGFDSRGPMVQSDDALRALLDGLGVAPQRIPTTLESRASLYRTMLAGRRMLILLDNAGDAEQVRLLLPGAPGCLVVVTSRDQLAGLAVADGALPVLLDVLSPAEAEELLARRISASRVRAEPRAVAGIISSCARLPLALAVTAARAAVRPGFRLADIAAELHDPDARWSALGGTDPATDVRAVLSWSYRKLSLDAAQLFRLLGLHPAPAGRVAALTALAARPQRRTRALLAELCAANLVTESPPGWFGCHDLLRDYARDLAEQIDSEADRRAAALRAFDHYLHTALDADLVLRPDTYLVPAGRPACTGGEPIPDEDSAMAWFATERDALRGVLTAMVAAGLDRHAWWLAWSIMTYLERRWDKKDWVAWQKIALAAARRLGEPELEAHSHAAIGFAYSELDLPYQARTHLTAGLKLFHEAGDLTAAALAHINLGVAARQLGRNDEALAEYQEALTVYRLIGSQQGEARALNNIGWCYLTMGDHEQAQEYCRRAIDMHEAAGNVMGAAHAWDSLGMAYAGQGRHREALAGYGRALAFFRQMRSIAYEAIIRHHIGDAEQAIGDGPAARDSWRQALALFTEIEHPDAETVAAKLAALAD